MKTASEPALAPKPTAAVLPDIKNDDVYSQLLEKAERTVAESVWSYRHGSGK